jgi:NTE family protein
MAHQMGKYLPETFAELKIPLAVTAVDLQEGQLVILSSGPLQPALRGTSSIPGIISTERHDERYLIDGGLLNNLPVDVIRSLTQAPVLAVDVASPPDRHIPVEDSLLDRAKNVLSGKKRPLAFEMFMKAFDIPAAMLTESRLALNPPDVLVRPRLDPDLKTEDMSRFAEAADAGFVATEAALELAQKELESRD